MSDPNEYMSVEPAAADILVRAAKGDSEAQAELVDLCLYKIDVEQRSPSLGYAMAELAARLAAAHGDIRNRLRLAHVLIRASAHAYGVGAFEDGASHHAEAIALFNELADEGDEEAAHALNAIVEASPPEMVAFAGKLKRRSVPQGGGESPVTYWSDRADTCTKG